MSQHDLGSSIDHPREEKGLQVVQEKVDFQGGFKTEGEGAAVVMFGGFLQQESSTKFLAWRSQQLVEDEPGAWRWT